MSTTSVTFTGLDDQGEVRPIGTLSWDGSEWSTEPADSGLDALTSAKVLARDEDGAPLLLSSDDPERWLEALHLRYRNPYFRAAKAVTTETPAGTPVAAPDV